MKFLEIIWVISWKLPDNGLETTSKNYRIMIEIAWNLQRSASNCKKFAKDCKKMEQNCKRFAKNHYKFQDNC